MRVVIFHPVSLPPKDYGGVERVVLWLARGLVQHGHEVWIAALEGSQLPPGVRLIAMSPDARSAHDLRGKLPEGIDVVHFMAPPEEGALESLGCAFLLTVHGNGQEGERFIANSVFLSADHARRHGAEFFVYNGIDPDEYEFDPRSKKDWHLFLSKTSWSVKNLRGAMRIAGRAKAKLTIAGGSRPLSLRAGALLRGFDWVGPVAGTRKARLLAEAKTLIFPVRWPEPFGLVVAEALISGTPVLASPRGSLPELVPSDVGALLSEDSDWTESLHSAGRWAPERCREWALGKFHYLKMAESYEKAYKRVISGENLQPRIPVATDWRKA